ncbi:MAG: hypothetical protein AB8B91_10280 [Rubripirellula sp.]
MTKVVALMNGIDISGNRLQQIMRQSEDREQPDFDDILEARKMQGLDIDLGLRSQKEHKNELSTMQAQLRDERQRFDSRRTAFLVELEEIRDGAMNEGLQQVQRMLQELDAAQAKEQLLMMYEDKRIDDVVTIIQAMSPDKRKDILGEFVQQEDKEKLADILKRISEGMPTTSLIDQVKDGG